jgi:iron complex outermembrane receptor protein
MKFAFLTVAVSILACVIGASGIATGARAQTVDLTKLSLEDLLSTEVTSVAKKPQRVDEAAAAVFVITEDDIRRSGSTTIPDLLRMVPGLEVAQLPSGGAAVTARGFNGFSANKLLVLVDGRAIYISALGGVLWDQQLVPVENIQRIEVVRGPGATLWGANAVNGVINIVTKHSVDTLGVAVTAQADTQSGDRTFAQFGAQVGPSTTLRVYATDHDLSDQLEGGHGLIKDYATGAQGGFRLDADPSPIDAITVQGDIQTGYNKIAAASPLTTLPPTSSIATLPDTYTFSGANIIARWTRTTSDRSGFSLQLDWDQVGRELLGFYGDVNQFNADFSDHFDVGHRNAIIWGVNYNLTSDTSTGTSHLYFTPKTRTDNLFGAYVEDDIVAIPDRLTVSIGTKLEHNDYSGFEVEPSIRALWRGSSAWSVWGAVSRAVRTPSQFEADLTYMTPFLVLKPGNSLTSEKMTAYEIGWRDQILPGVALDLTAYHQEYYDLISWGFAGIVPPGVAEVQYGNHGHGQSTGVELAASVSVTPQWTIKLAGDLMNLAIAPGGLNTVLSSNAIDQGASPDGQASVRSLWNVTDDIDFDVWYRHVAKLATGPIPAYDDLNLRLAWRPTAHIELSLMGDHLLSAERIEIRDPTEPLPAIIARQGLVKVAMRY